MHIISDNSDIISQPDLIAFFQVQCRLEGHRIIFKSDARVLLNITRPD
jgi:hypothetical protein